MKSLGGPSKLTNYYIQRLAIQLLTSESLNQQERAIALKLLRYDDQSKVSDKWIFLVLMYKQINNVDSVVAKTIQTLFEQNFEQPILITLDSDSPEVSSITRRDGSGSVIFSAKFVAKSMESIIYRHCYYNSQAMGLIPFSDKTFDNEDFLYYKFLRIFVKNQIAHINDPQDSKSMALAPVVKKIAESKESPEELKELVPDIRQTCRVHRDNVVMGTLKFNFFRSPRSLEIISSLYNETNELLSELRSTAEFN